jgi:hypothetical protein
MSLSRPWLLPRFALPSIYQFLGSDQAYVAGTDLLVLLTARRSHITSHAHQPLKPLLFLWVNGRELFSLGFRLSGCSGTASSRSRQCAIGYVHETDFRSLQWSAILSHDLIENSSAIVLMGSLNFEQALQQLFG